MADAIAVASGTADAQAFTGAGKLAGFSAHESGAVATATSLIIRDGTSVAGKALAYVELATNASETVAFPDPIEFQTGLFIDRAATGETAVTVYVE